jgi:hypothetical protein
MAAMAPVILFLTILVSPALGEVGGSSALSRVVLNMTSFIGENDG